MDLLTPPAQCDFTIYRGATFHPEAFTITEGPTDADEDQTPIDFSGATAKMQIRATVGAPDVLLELSTTNGRLVLGGTAGTIAMRLSATETGALTWKKGVYDIEVTLSSNDTFRPIRGKVTVDPDVTR